MNRSENIGQLSAALAKAQASIRGASKDAQNPHLRNRYADLASTWEACRDALTANGLAVTQLPTIGDDGGQHLDTVLCHESGEWVSSRIPLVYGEEKGLKPMQAMGSALTYARRYGLAAIVGVCPEDDDGEGAGHGSGGHRQHQQRPAPAREPEPAPRRPEPLTAMLDREVAQINRDWTEIVREHTGDDAPAVLIGHRNEVINHFVTAAIDAGALDAAAVDNGQGKRDAGKSLRALEAMYAKSPTKWHDKITDYLEGKLADARAKLPAPEAATR